MKSIKGYPTTIEADVARMALEAADVPSVVVAGTQVSGLLDGWTAAPSTYAIRAQNTADVVASSKVPLRCQVRAT
jgi:hypothetical protein